MVSNNLLSYNIQDTVMNTSIKHPRMINPGTNNVFIQQHTNPGGLEVHTTDMFIEIDTTAARESMGLGQLRDSEMIKYFAQKGKETMADLTRRIVRKGDMVCQNRTTPVELAKMEFKEKKAPKDVETVFYPSESADIHVTPGKTDIQHHPTEVNIDWQNTAIVPYQLDRGTVTFDIVQRAYVDLTYLGDPIFFPDPSFQAWA